MYCGSRATYAQYNVGFTQFSVCDVTDAVLWQLLGQSPSTYSTQVDPGGGENGKNDKNIKNFWCIQLETRMKKFSF
jgi:hypothetical protein